MKKNKITFTQFKDSIQKGNTCIPVYKRILADVLTPVGVWAALNQNINFGFIFESVEKNSKRSRYSYIGINPNSVFVSKGSKTKIIKNNKTKIIDKTITDLIRENQYMYNQKHTNDLPPFSGGVVGYLSYESVRWYEDIHTHQNKMIPDSIFMLFKDVIAFDHINGDAIVISNVKINNDTRQGAHLEQALL